MSNQPYNPISGCRVLGAIRALHGVQDCYVIVHSLMGCHSGFMLLELLQDHSNVRVLYSGVHQDDIVYGTERRLYKAIVTAYEVFRPRLIAVVEGNASALIGTDIENTVEKAKKEHNISVPVVIFKGGGHSHDMRSGFEEALMLLSSFVQKQKENTRRRRSVNLLGIKPDDFRARQDIAEIKKLLDECGVEVNAVVPGGDLDDVKRLGSADLTVVVGGDGLNLARYLEREYGVPYIVVPYPFGLNNTYKFLEETVRELGLDARRVEDLYSRAKSEIKSVVEKSYFNLKALLYASTVVIGDPGRSLSLAQMLASELLMDVHAVVLHYGYASELMQKLSLASNVDVLEKPSQDKVEKLAENSEILFGSSLERNICRRLGVPLVRFSFPVTDMVALTDCPLAGFAGYKTWIEHILNSVNTM